MQLVVNGKPSQLSDDIATLEDIRVYYGLKPNTVIMELNGSLYKDPEFHTTLLSDNDILEIVHFMGGGGII